MSKKSKLSKPDAAKAPSWHTTYSEPKTSNAPLWHAELGKSKVPGVAPTLNTPVDSHSAMAAALNNAFAQREAQLAQLLGQPSGEVVDSAAFHAFSSEKISPELRGEEPTGMGKRAEKTMEKKRPKGVRGSKGVTRVSSEQFDRVLGPETAKLVKDSGNDGRMVYIESNGRDAIIAQDQVKSGREANRSENVVTRLEQERLLVDAVKAVSEGGSTNEQMDQLGSNVQLLESFRDKLQDQSKSLNRVYKATKTRQHDKSNSKNDRQTARTEKQGHKATVKHLTQEIQSLDKVIAKLEKAQSKEQNADQEHRSPGLGRS